MAGVCRLDELPSRALLFFALGGCLVFCGGRAGDVAAGKSVLKARIDGLIVLSPAQVVLTASAGMPLMAGFVTMFLCIMRLGTRLFTLSSLFSVVGQKAIYKYKLIITDRYRFA